jgi:sodium/potassium-transporting ATPase subunit beta
MGGNPNKKFQDYDDSFGTYLWNPATKQFFGRTGTMWAKLVVFYTIFYIGLAAFFGLYFYLFSQTLDAGRPKWILGESLIGTNPGMGYRPMPSADDNPESTLIWYKRDSSDAQFWYQQLDDYMNSVDNPIDTDDVVNCNYNGTRASEDRCCRVYTNDFGTECSRKNNFGYKTGEPCILLKLNRIFGWEPLGYGLNSKGRYDQAQLAADLNEQVKNKGMPESLKDYILDGLKDYPTNKEEYLSTIWISCRGEDVADQENIGNIRYYPKQGIPGYYFPYYMQKGYQSPFIFVQFQHPLESVLINIECKAWAKNIVHDKINRLGSVHFELLID